MKKAEKELVPKKKNTFAIVVVCAFLFLWLVVLTIYVRNPESAKQQKLSEKFLQENKTQIQREQLEKKYRNFELEQTDNTVSLMVNGKCVKKWNRYETMYEREWYGKKEMYTQIFYRDENLGEIDLMLYYDF